MELELRPLTESDSALLFRWANDIDVRKNAVNQAPIALVNHENWFEKKMNDPECKIYIMEERNRALGQIRFDYNGNEWEIDYSIDRNERGRGLGFRILELGMKSLKNNLQTSVTFKAMVDRNNIGSIRVFQKNHFIKTDSIKMNNRCFEIFKRTF